MRGVSRTGDCFRPASHYADHYVIALFKTDFWIALAMRRPAEA